MLNNIEQHLWNYIDNTCNAEERKMIEGLLQNDDEWRKKYQELQQVNELMHESIELEEPSMRFTKNVMEEIAQSRIAPATKTYINKRIINTIAAFFIVIIGGLLVYGFAQINWSVSGNNTWSIDPGKLDISKYFSKQVLNIFLMLNVVLGLILFDRFLGKKKSGTGIIKKNV
jgi:hypothetical protein